MKKVHDFILLCLHTVWIPGTAVSKTIILHFICLDIYIYMRYHLTATGKKTKQALVFLYWRQGFGILPDDLFRTGTGSTCVRNT